MAVDREDGVLPRSNGVGARSSSFEAARWGVRLMVNCGGAGGGQDDADDTYDKSLDGDAAAAEEELATRYQPSAWRSLSIAARVLFGLALLEDHRATIRAGRPS